MKPAGMLISSAMALISSVSSRPDSNFGRYGSRTRRLKLYTARPAATGSSSLLRLLHKRRRLMLEPLDEQRVVRAVAVDLVHELIQPLPPHEVALRQADRVVFDSHQ